MTLEERIAFQEAVLAHWEAQQAKAQNAEDEKRATHWAANCRRVLKRLRSVPP